MTAILDKPQETEIMKRDMELIRKILLEIQAKDDLDPEEIYLDDEDDMSVIRHIDLLAREGFIEGEAAGSIGPRVFKWRVQDLTWAGHDFVGAIQKDEWWQKIKDQIGPSELASLSMKTIKDIAVAWVAAHVKNAIGL